MMCPSGATCLSVDCCFRELAKCVGLVQSAHHHYLIAGHEPTICHTRGEHANHYTTDAIVTEDQYMYDPNEGKLLFLLILYCGIS
jgi:hypothetical protein